MPDNTVTGEAGCGTVASGETSLPVLSSQKQLEERASRRVGHPGGCLKAVGQKIVGFVLDILEQIE